MIDAISSHYSSNHGGRLKFNSTSQSQPQVFRVLVERGADTCSVSKKPKQTDLNSFLVVSGGAAALGMIISTLFSSNELAKGNFSMIGDIMRVAAVMGVIGGACLAVFKLLENNVLDKICK